jgi:GT2 family glycosyltransferase
MRLSIIIVNHNECDLLKQSVSSLISACNRIDYELIIIDNASTDGSVAMIGEHFPNARLIANSENSGIAKANNQGLNVCSGEYVLMVTPDTKCGKDSLEKMLDFMDLHTDAGGLSIRLISPQGRFIPESIHGLNNIWAAFFRLTGFAKQLAKTRLYDKARKDWVDEFQVTEIDIVNGACMLLRSSALSQVGPFDERFVQYGHDIDPKTYFFKYQDQQEQSFTLNHIRHLVGAMLQFAIKYIFRFPDIKVQELPQLYPTSYQVKG